MNVDVPDLAAAERFYVAALGLAPGRRFGPYAVELLGLEAPLYLLANEEGSSPAPGVAAHRGYRRHWTPVHLDLAVDDLEAAIAQAVAAGAKLEGAPKEKKWGRIAVLADPFGHGFCLLQFTGRGYDEVAEPARPSRT